MDHDENALIYAEKHGIIDYEINANVMTYTETFPLENGTYTVSVNLITMEEKRSQKTYVA